MSHTNKPTPLTARKSKPLTGMAAIPGDKSMSHRALMLSALAEGESIIGGLLEGEDVLCTAAAMRAMGAQVQRGDDGLWRVRGTGTNGLRAPKEPLDMGNSGTSTRLLMGLVAGYPISAEFIGDASLSKRPMNRVIKPLEEMGARFEASEGGRLPLTVHGSNHLKPINYELPVASAQVKSALLLAGLSTEGMTTIIENKPTRDHSENMLRHFGARVLVHPLENGGNRISIEGPQRLKACAVDVPCDPSSAAFPAVAAIITPDSAIELEHIGMSKTRNGLYITLKEMGADIEFKNQRTDSGEPVAEISVRYNGALKGIDVPPERVPSMIDEFPILAVAASCARGITRMTGLAELRVKESDRLLMMANGLKACGVELEMGDDSLIIFGTGNPPQGGASIKTALDHRIAMSFLILGGVTREPVTIDDSAPIRTSFPNFIDLMNDLGAQIG